MKSEKEKVSADAMAFFHDDGLPAAWKQAMKFAGQGGRIATLPDIVAARLESKPGDLPWETYFTTLTAEYCGLTKAGNHILIVAHGVGPMSTLDGICQAYSHEYQDKNRSRRGGRITQQEFWDLEAGKFGQIEVIDLDEYYGRYKYPFIQILRASEALTDPVLKARLGPEAEKYVQAHAEFARAWHREQAGFDPEYKNKIPADVRQRYLDRRLLQHQQDGAEDADPFIIQLGDAANCCYGYRDYHDYGFGNKFVYRKIEDGLAIAHLVSIGSLCQMHHEGNESLVHDVDCHEWWNGVRLVGIKAGGCLRTGLEAGPDAYRLLRQHWRELLVPMPEPEMVGFRGLMQIEDQWFTQYPKAGDGLDTWEPEYAIMALEKIGEPVFFRTEVGGYHGFFKFGANEVQAIAPPPANAYYFTGEPEIEWHDGNPTHHTCLVQFYRVEADTAKRLMRRSQLSHDYERMMQLLELEQEAV